MKRLLSVCLLVGAMALGACTTVPDSAPGATEQAEIAAAVASAPESDRAEILVAVTAEVGARFRCPRNPLELQVLAGVRIAFDMLARPKLQPASAAIVDELRARTDVACGIVIAEAPPEPPPTEPTI